MVIRDFLQDKLASFAIPRYISVVSCVHPGGIRTNIARNARFNRAMYSLTREKSICLYEEELFKTTADDAARVIISGIKRNRRRIMVGTDAKVIDLITRMFPVTAMTLCTGFSRYIARSYARK